jgi:DNA-directed RNA polymerase specialized sigma24 family protein
MLTTDIQELEAQGQKWLRAKHRKLPRMDRDDILQDALIVLVRKLEAGPVDNPGGLLGTIIDGRVKDYIRKNVRIRAVEQPTPDMSAVSPVALQTFDDLVFAVTLDQTVRTLPSELRDSFILMDLRGLTSFEASTLLDRPASTIRNHRNEARDIIRKELA